MRFQKFEFTSFFTALPVFYQKVKQNSCEQGLEIFINEYSFSYFYEFPCERENVKQIIAFIFAYDYMQRSPDHSRSQMKYRKNYAVGYVCVCFSEYNFVRSFM